jgi:hypothetical protein
MAADCAAQTRAVAARTPRTGVEAARVPAVADPKHRCRRAAGEVVVADAPEAEVGVAAAVAARGGETAVEAVLRDAGLQADLGYDEVQAARVAAAGTRGEGAAAAQNAAAVAADGEAAAGGAGVVVAGASRVAGGRGREGGAERSGQRKTTVFWSPCPYRHMARSGRRSYYLPPSPFGSTGIVRCVNVLSRPRPRQAG